VRTCICFLSTEPSLTVVIAAVEDQQALSKKYKAAEEELKGFKAKGGSAKGGDKRTKELELVRWNLLSLKEHVS